MTEETEGIDLHIDIDAVVVQPDEEEEEVEGKLDGLRFLHVFDIESRRSEKLRNVIDYSIEHLADRSEIFLDRIAIRGFVGNCRVIVKGEIAAIVFPKRIIDLVKGMTGEMDRILFGPDNEARQEIHDLSLKWWPKKLDEIVEQQDDEVNDDD